MRHQAMWMCVLLALLVVLAPVGGYAARKAGGDGGGAKTTRQPKQPKLATAPKSEFSGLTTDLNLTTEQQAQLDQKASEMQTALNDWNAKNKDQMSQLRKDMKTATDKADAEKMQADLKALEDERTAIEAKYRKDMIAILTPDQQATWAAHKIYLKNDYAPMVKTCQLSPQQEQQIKDKVKETAAADNKWSQDNGDNVSKLEKQIKEAQAALAKVKADEAKIMTDGDAAVVKILTPEQQDAWAGYKLQQSTMAHFAKLTLTDDQKTKAKTLCDATAKDIKQLAAGDTKGRKDAETKLVKSITDQVLTDAQKEEMKKAAPKERPAKKEKNL